MSHAIEKTPDGYRCAVCGQTWKGEPRSNCPGLPVYAWLESPDHLKTRKQLRAVRLKPGGPVRAYLKGRDLYDLFDQAEAVPVREISEKQRQALEKGRALAGTSECPSCHRRVDDEFFGRGGVCLGCEEREFHKMVRDARDGAIRWARAWVGRAETGGCVILDSETTGTEGKDEVVQVAVINLLGETLLEALIKPTQRIPLLEVSAIHGITDEMVKDAPTFADLYPRLVGLLGDNAVIAYNAGFDRRMLKQSAAKYGLAEITAGHWMCAMEAYAEFYGEWSRHWKSFKWQPLQGGDHSALGDCRATLELIKQMAAAKLSTEETIETQGG